MEKKNNTWVKIIMGILVIIFIILLNDTGWNLRDPKEERESMYYEEKLKMDKEEEPGLARDFESVGDFDFLHKFLKDWGKNVIFVKIVPVIFQHAGKGEYRIWFMDPKKELRVVLAMGIRFDGFGGVGAAAIKCGNDVKYYTHKHMGDATTPMFRNVPVAKYDIRVKDIVLETIKLIRMSEKKTVRI